MPFTHSISLTWGAGGDLIGTAVSKTGGIEQNFSLGLGTVTHQLIDLEWAAAKLLAIFIVVDADCTLKLNSSGSPTDTIALKPGAPFCWVRDSGVAYPFVGTAGAVTAGYVTTAAATGIEIRTLLDL
ncbi:hypothetical protein GobsT_12200 [Gemmata obscuriglobus]|uniref:Uncharacterized protein n=1 Tax=Gemmata obscuriglobus TaxID=114 RepID=A0A2Z3H5Z2_9BACT|nr:hypothetical protein [Gemmata obscuriglobus]AWM40311.1 hypothetical protein C1280_27110 [Gemmata obscuriglobus]QEG26480.1 hypothetical protein GobsT_12200 [Gemmata obscuriglobus]VTS01728.1 Uncultured bacterium genome assembly Metasoil_fosmids_resub OS=uncultured bacterium PE=4 SV=1 [Gemmata obscuriglobus UQM 2246]